MCFQDRVLICTRGFWQQAWYACDTSQGEDCVVGRTIEHRDFVSCILPDMGVCSATDPPACLGNTIVECQPVGRWARTQDCARFEQVCLNGRCVSSTVLPERP